MMEKVVVGDSGVATSVFLTVTDNLGAENTASQPVIGIGAPVNFPPVAVITCYVIE